MSTTLEKFKNYLQELQNYFHVNNLLYWDMRTATPVKGLEANSEAIAYFSTKEFELKTSDELGAMLTELSKPEEYNALDDMMKFVVMNSAAFHLIPTTVAALRRDYGSENPFDIMPASWISSAAALTVGLIAAFILIKISEGISCRK